jgi:hypothetical protein
MSFLSFNVPEYFFEQVGNRDFAMIDLDNSGASPSFLTKILDAKCSRLVSSVELAM